MSQAKQKHRDPAHPLGGWQLPHALLSHVTNPMKTLFHPSAGVRATIKKKKKKKKERKKKKRK